MPARRHLDLSFIARDIRNQLAHSREILSQVEVLRNVASMIEDAGTKAQVEDSIRGLLSIANNVTINAQSTMIATTIRIGEIQCT